MTEKRTQIFDINLCSNMLENKVEEYIKAKYEADLILKRICDDLLTSTNKYLLDYPLTEDSKIQIKKYRRDIINILNCDLLNKHIKTDCIFNRPIIEISKPIDISL